MRVRIPELNYNCPMYIGENEIIDRGAVGIFGVGRLPVNYREPGVAGTIWAGAHHDSHGGAFQRLPEISIGAEIIVDGWFSDRSFPASAGYRVISKRIVPNHDHNYLWWDGDSFPPRIVLQTSWGSRYAYLIDAEFVWRDPPF
jgi:sortase (surface protein transpeptidase)